MNAIFVPVVWLILSMNTGSGVTIDKVPFETMEHCIAAAERFTDRKWGSDAFCAETGKPKDVDSE